MGTGSLEGEIAEFIDQQELRLAVKQEPVRELAFGFGFRQGSEQRRRAGEEHRVTGLDDRPAQRDREVRLADARGAQEQHVFGLSIASGRYLLREKMLLYTDNLVL
jgi:hypothetical protein